MTCRLRTTRFLLLTVSLCAVFNHFTATGKNNSDSIAVTGIYTRLLTVVPKPDGIQWPPPLEISDENVTNAFAKTLADNQYKVIITRKIISGCNCNPSCVAYILAHELAHITLRHKSRERYGKLINLANMRSDEYDADSLGLQYALKAGYSLREIVSCIYNMRECTGNYSSIEALSVDHPSWT